ncbi:MAG: pyridoxine 5'-phosphate synthase [Spirochaetes bacterium GWD1_27_9]|nr:MAG: pyridoxine 5'-phosphate synthase [Spirochaetes bacterium GWB1_27_13]OHD28293.1 MAG: pyridoxine 5'-phosphate synthase [Spirochaetes bacterium GWC1_27_15]OHD35060.1 MAG: pyridoxine 5'-phosphate synthase [Spirochaetes bacterium GWD1_27_9]
MIKLGVNIDHIATLRNARGDFFPSLVYAANIVEQNGGDFITIHLREDRRHIKDNDLFLLKDNVTTYINLEMACNEDVLQKALKAKPYKVTLVPERRDEVTTEGGLNVKTNFAKVKDYVSALQNEGIKVSLFVEADISQIESYKNTGAKEIEIHTGKYSLAKNEDQIEVLKEISSFAKKANACGLTICAGHGLNYHNTQAICMIKEIVELNIGYSIVTKSLFNGLDNAVKEMKQLIIQSEKICLE